MKQEKRKTRKNRSSIDIKNCAKVKKAIAAICSPNGASTEDIEKYLNQGFPVRKYLEWLEAEKTIAKYRNRFRCLKPNKKLKKCKDFEPISSSERCPIKGCKRQRKTAKCNLHPSSRKPSFCGRRAPAKKESSCGFIPSYYQSPKGSKKRKNRQSIRRYPTSDTSECCYKPSRKKSVLRYKTPKRKRTTCLKKEKVNRFCVKSGQRELTRCKPKRRKQKSRGRKKCGFNGKFKKRCGNLKYRDMIINAIKAKKTACFERISAYMDKCYGVKNNFVVKKTLTWLKTKGVVKCSKGCYSLTGQPLNLS